MENKKRENIIYLKDLLFVVFYSWKQFIAAGLILAVALGSYKFVSGWAQISDEETLENNKIQNQIMMERYEAEFNTLELQISTLRESIQNQQIYLDNSIRMRLDPYAYYEASLNVYIETDYQIMPGMDYQNPDKTAAIVNAYCTVLMSDDSLQTISDAIGTEPQYLLEIFSVSGNGQLGTLTVTASCPTHQEAQQILELMVQQVEAAYTQVAETVEAHTSSIMEKDIRQQLNKALEDSQSVEATRLNTMVTSLANAQMQKLSLVAPTEQATTPTAVIKQSIKMAIVGGILGVLLSAFIVWVIHITSGKVYSARTLTDRTCVKVLGCLNTKPSKNAIDHWLHKLEGRSTADMQEQLDLIAANIGNRCGDIRTLLITGSTDPQDRTALEEALRKRLTGVQLVNCASVLDSAAALDALHSCDCVLLVEQCKYSRYDSIAQQANIIVDYGKEVLGCVLYGG